MTSDQPSRNGGSTTQAHIDDEINLRDVYNLLLRNWVVLVLALAVTVGAAWAFSYYTVPVYQSIATLRIDEQQGANVPVLDVLQELSAGSEVATEMEVLRSRILAERVVDSLGLKLRPTLPKGVSRSVLLSGLFIEPWSPAAEYRLVNEGDGTFAITNVSNPQAPLGSVSVDRRGTIPGASFTVTEAALAWEEIHLEVVGFDRAVQRLRRNVDVSRPNRDASIVTLRYESTDTALVRDVPNLLAEAFIARRQDVQTTEARSTVAFLEEQIDTLERQLTDAEEALVAYQQGEQVVSLGAEADAQVAQLATLQAQRFQVEADRQTLQDLVDQVEAEVRARGDDPAEMAASPYTRLISFPPLLQNQAVGNLLNQLNTITTLRTELLERRLPSDLEVQNFTAQIRGIEDQLRDLALGYLGSLNNQVANLDAQLASFQQDLERIPVQRVEELRLTRETTVLESIYTLLNSRLEEARIVTAIEDPTVRVVDPAILPPQPVRPRTLLNLLLGAVLGGMLGVGIAFTREYMDDSIHTREDIQRATGNAPILGMIPRINGRSSGAPKQSEDEIGHLEDRLVAGRDPRNPVSEAYRSLRTNLTFSNPDDPPRVVVFTSALPQDGKSTSAANLAITLAQQGHSTLLIDADLRRGVLNNVFGTSREPGLSNVLAGHASLSEAIRPVELGHSGSIRFMPSGPFPPNPAELLGSARMKSLIDELETRYDFVILDSAPLTIVTDAAVLGTKVDGVVLVARANRTEKGALTYAVEQLLNVRAPVLGTVLNDVDYRRDSRYSSRYGRYGYYYQYYYGEDGKRKDEKRRDPKRARMGQRS